MGELGWSLKIQSVSLVRALIGRSNYLIVPSFARAISCSWLLARR